MKRRNFLGLFGAAAVAPLLVHVDIVREESRGIVDSPTVGYCTPEQIIYYVRARADCKAHDLVCVQEGVPFGVALDDIPAGKFGRVQVGGSQPVMVRVYGL